ncbi:MAG: radical SAM protein [Desulfatibacillaceae bacterium]
MKPFQVLVKPASGDCNLACDYCFYRHKGGELYPDARRRMTPEVAEDLVAGLLSYRFPETVFSWQGGEPTLMGLDFFVKVVEAQMRHGAPGQVIGNALQTNGVLIDREWARFLAEYRFMVGLSLDGPADVHDAHRRTASGTGSHDRALAAADRLLTAGVATNALCVVNATNQDRAPEVIDHLVDNGLDHIQFIPVLETDPRTGEPTSFSATPEGLGRFYEDACRVLAPAGVPRFSERTLEALLHLRLAGEAGLCVFDKQCGRYLLIEHNGDVYPCDFFVEDKWRLGNIAHGELAGFFKNPLYRRFARAKPRLPGECRTCGDLASCHGGCVKDRLPDRAEGTAPTYFCESYKRLFRASGPMLDAVAENAMAQAPAAPMGRNEPCPCGSGRKYKRCCGKR